MKLIESDELRKQMGKESHQFIHENFNKKHQLQAIKALYRSLLSEGE
jgi:hypothetical protein